MSKGLLVAGVGRAGTSIATHLASTMGLRLPRADDLMTGNRGNPHGYWESLSLSAFNDRLLARWDRDWWTPPATITEEMWRSLEEFRSSAMVAFAATFGEDDGWVWKDPRLTVLLPYWEKVLGLNPILFPYRQPQAVARSLVRRDQMTYAHGLAVWERHTRLALASLAGRRVALVSFQDLLADPEDWIAEVFSFCRDAGLPVRKPDRVAKSVHPPSSGEDGWLSAEQADLLTLLQSLKGTHAKFPELGTLAESSWVGDILTMGRTHLATTSFIEVSNAPLRTRTK